MAKTPGLPPDSGESIAPEDARAEFWEATFFSADGKEITTQNQAPKASAPDTPTMKPVPAQPVAAAAAASATDQDIDHAFNERLSREAAASVEKHADDLGEALHAKFMHLLTSKLEQTGGRLSADDVAEMGEEFKDNIEDIKTAFLDAVESYTLAREQRRLESVRENYFTRLMVRKFEHRFRDERKLIDQPEYLSRRMLPGFASMLSMMFGKPQLASYEKRIRAVAERLKHENGGDLDWEQFYRTPEIKKLALRAEIEIAQNFRDINKRLSWMIAMINSNLIPPDDRWAGAEWNLNEEAASKMLTSLFADLRAALKNPNARERFGDSLGEEAIAVLDGVATRFN